MSRSKRKSKSAQTRRTSHRLNLGPLLEVTHVRHSSFEGLEVLRHEEIVRGIKPGRIKRLIDQGMLVAKQVYQAIPERTFSRRLSKGEALKTLEADAIGRLVRVTATADKIFGNVEFSRNWLNLPNPSLQKQVPIEMAQTDAGAREVENVLSRIAHGDYS